MLSDLVGSGWVEVGPPLEDDEISVVARYDGEPIKAGFKLETVEDTDEIFHAIYRSGSFDVELKIDFEIGRGQLRVDEAEGYDA